MAIAAELTALSRGHQLTPWEPSQNPNGKTLVSHCLKCGAMAIAEYDDRHRSVRNGTTQHRACLAIRKSKATKDT